MDKSRTLISEQRCGLLSNPHGQLLFVLEKDITPPPQWVEYDAKENCLTLIHHDGTEQGTGLDIDHKTKKNLAASDKITLAVITNGQPKETAHIPLVTKKYE